MPNQHNDFDNLKFVFFSKSTEVCDEVSSIFPKRIEGSIPEEKKRKDPAKIIDSGQIKSETQIVKILKFGGSSVGSSDRIKNVIKIIKKAWDENPRIGVVISAFVGSTDQLIALGNAAAAGEDYQKALSVFIARHLNTAIELIPHEKLHLEDEIQELSKKLQEIYLTKELSLKTQDLLMSFGERLSAKIIAKAIQPLIPEARFVDARAMIKTDRQFGSAKVDFESTYQNIMKCFKNNPCLPIITGFIGSSKENETTTLGRGGSDYTASIVGAAFDVSLIEIWTDVNGMLTADPKKEPNALPILEMSYEEAMEMSHFGAKVIHPPTIVPACKKKIPILIKNTFDPNAPGTKISSNTKMKHVPRICGVSSIEDVSLYFLQEKGVIGICSLANRLFGALAEKGIHIILISQGSSEHSICVAIASSFAGAAKEVIQKEFALEMRAGLIGELNIQNDLTVVAVIGEQMRQKPGIAGQLFGSLEDKKINVIAIAQGSSELNISVVVKKNDGVKAIQAIHQAFFSHPILNIFLVGVGLIGSTLLRLIQSHTRIPIRLIGIANSRHMVFNPDGIPLEKWFDVLNTTTEKTDMNAIIDKMDLLNTVFVDCTSSQAIADLYEKILNSGISIVTPNKKANSGRYEDYQKLRRIAAQRKVKFYYGTNVGAGLPMISSIKDLVHSGDKITKIEAILSGSLSYILNSLTEKKSFSQVVHEAQEKGYMEPDPHDDLSGEDVARKLLILARESGYALEMDEIVIEPLDRDRLESMRIVAQRQGKILRYIASLQNGLASVSLHIVGPDHPFYQLSGNDNIIAINSVFYPETPLIIRGAGAGAEITARRILAEIIQLIVV